MKINRTTIIFVLFIMNIIGPITAQEFSVEILPLSKQLPSNSVQRVFQDREGFMWFGTREGLSRYDGYRILTFRSGKTTPDLLTDNQITCITDSWERILIGTKKGLNILNKKTYEISHIDNEELKDQEIRSILFDSKGYIWVGTYVALYRCSSDFSSCKRYDSSLPVTSVNSIYEDADKNIWVTFWRKGIFRYDRVKDTFVKYPSVGKENNPFCVFQDDKKQHWIGTWGEGLYKFYPEEKNEQIYIPVKSIKEGELPENGTFFSIQQDDRYGYLWLVSARGLYAIRKRVDNFVETVDISDISSKLNNIFSEICKDKAGNLWIASFNEGVSYINMDKPVIQNYLMPFIKEMTGLTTNIQAIYKDKDGDIWINQNRLGLGIYKKDSDKIIWYKDIPDLNSLSGMETINFIGYSSSNDEIWVGPSYQPFIYTMKKENGKIRLISRLNLQQYTKGAGNNPQFFYEDKKQNVWIVTSLGLLVKPANSHNILKETGFLQREITGLAEDNSGHIWISTRRNGVFCLTVSEDFQIRKENIVKFDMASGRLISDNIEDLCTDEEGRVWMGSQEGYVFLYDQKTKTVEDYSDIFPTLTEGVQDMKMDDTGHLWISTNKKIIEYDPKTGGQISYQAGQDIVVNSFPKHSCFKSPVGEMFYGGNRGIAVFVPYKKLADKPKKIRTHIVDVKMDDESLLTGKTNERFNLLKRTLKLHAEDQNIEIDFSSLNYSFPTKIQYAYKMEGVDKDWVYIKDGRLFAYYNQLPKGKRTFCVKATDVNGLWSSLVTKIQVDKAPAFYETWWAYTAYVVFVLLAGYSFYYRTKRRMQLRHELRIVQIEKEKSEELVQAKLRYFTNISHDLLTPLTIVTCLIDDAEITYKNKIPQFEMIRANVNRLKRLLQQILDFRKVESGNMKLKVTSGDIVSLIYNVCNSNFMPLIQKKKLTISFESSEDTIQAYFDVDKIDKVVFNLLSNACKYTEEGGEIKIALSTHSQNGHTYLSIIVSDTGKGIAPEDLDKIFTRFYTNQHWVSSETNGIGLSLTKDLLEIHHGTISVESEIEKGTSFTVIIPIDKESYAESEINIESSQELRKEGRTDIVDVDMEAWEQHEGENVETTVNDIHLLLVEDNEELLYLMERILSRRYHVMMAKNGVEALELMKDNEVDIIVSDVMMPEMDGLELCRTIKGNLETSHIPIILLTAKNTAEDRIECYNAGANAYISKPFELKVLEARLDNFLMDKRTKQEEFRTDIEDINFNLLDATDIDKEFLEKVIEVIQENLSSSTFDVIQLADALAMSKSSLYRKTKAIIGLSPVEFIRNVRLKQGVKMLRNKSISVSEVAYTCGFSNPKYFSTCFKEEFGVTPKEFQKADTKINKL